MNKRIQKKKETQAEAAHEHELEGTPWGRITLSYEHLQSAFREFALTLAQEARTYGGTLRGELQQGMKSVDDAVGDPLSRVPVVGPRAARQLHEFATDPPASELNPETA